MAQQELQMMGKLGLDRFSVAGHNRGGRVAYRFALEHPDRINKLSVFDVLPLEIVLGAWDARFALAFWPWSLLAQPEPLPERVVKDLLASL